MPPLVYLQRPPTEEENQPQTLDSIPEVLVPKRAKLGKMIQQMQQSGFHSWGFVIFRGYYRDDDKWRRYLQAMKDESSAWLLHFRRHNILPQYQQWTVVEDRSLENVSKQTVRQKFAEWCNGRSEARDGPGAEHALVPRSIPRFNYCIYVNETCINMLPPYEEWAAGGFYGPEKSLPMIFIDRDCEPEGEGKDGQPDVEGCTRSYTGWMYCDIGSMTEMYNIVAGSELEEGYSYARPPLLYPSHQQGVTVPE